MRNLSKYAAPGHFPWKYQQVDIDLAFPDTLLKCALSAEPSTTVVAEHDNASITAVDDARASFDG